MKIMKKGAAIAWMLIIAIAIGGLGYLGLGYVNNTVSEKEAEETADGIRLGLDLAGGVSITYQVVGDAPSNEEMEDTMRKISSRIENDLSSESSTTEYSVYKNETNTRITVEIPGVTDANALLEELGTPGKLYFIKQYNADGAANYTFNGEEYVLNFDIEELEANGSIVCTGSEVSGANGTTQQNQTTGAVQYVVDLSLNDAGTEAFASATAEAFANGQSIGIYYDGHFVSVPNVQAVISDGKCVITGMEDMDAANKLASYIRIGGLSVELEEIQSEVVGAQLGSAALATSLKAGLIGLILVMVFLIIMYLVPGVASSLALALYTALLVCFIKWFDLTLTLPGIAGMVLSIGMAVDANVIIFARIREEIATGRSVASAIEEGFKKAFWAIFDGNVTTLIAAAVLAAIGSGTVKGFAVTLALGVILSMFTALVVTRIIVKALYALGVKSEKAYGKAKERKELNFIGRKAIFFGISLAIIAVGFITMAVQGAMGNGSLNWSLEFKGGSTTTVVFNEEYTLADLEATVVPEIAKITGDNDIQTTVVDATNEVIFKTRGLELDEREAFNTMLEDKFGVNEASITSENISPMISGEMRRTSLIAVIVAAFFMLIYIWIRFKDIRFASSAIIALVHDVLVVLALYAVARISVGSAFVACMLTVIGYSVNDTIVVFDRIRENQHALTKETPETLKELANKSVTQTISRSISTSITTAIMVLMLLILGVSTIRSFALPLLAGVICGTYSSICIATELWYVFKVRFVKKSK